MQKVILEQKKIYFYISTKANSYTPAKTIFLCAPEKDAGTVETAENFAKKSGWLDLAEKDGAVLVMPIAENGWKREEPTLIAELYEAARKEFPAPEGDSIPGRDGFVWCWETLVYLAGYEEGAEFAGNTVVAVPNRFAGAALINGVPHDFQAGSRKSDHWLVRQVSQDYSKRNDELPVCVWMFGKKENQTEKERERALNYFKKSNLCTAMAKQECIGGIPTEIYVNEKEEAWQIRVSEGEFQAEPVLSGMIMEKFFNHFIRWKNAPDGTLKTYLSKEEFDTDSRFIHDEIKRNEYRYPFHVYLPEGMKPEDAKNLPVVFSIHGRGEPAWIFSTKNAWDRLADETHEFLLVLPDSPQNIWLIERDREVFGEIIEKLYERYQIDKTRIYLTGFSNGGMIIRQLTEAHPEQFAAVSPWNAPFVDSFDKLIAEKWEMPCFIFAGDQDEKVPLWENLDSLLENMLKANGCCLREAEGHRPLKYIPDLFHDQDNFYTKENGYEDGGRMQTFLFKNKRGLVRVGFTLMKNMPHGAVYDQSRATWEFLRKFSRIPGSKKVLEQK